MAKTCSPSSWRTNSPARGARSVGFRLALVLAALCALLPTSTIGQTQTQVTFVVKDGSSFAYAGASVSITLNGGSGAGPNRLTPCSNPQTNCPLPPMPSGVVVGSSGSTPVTQLYASGSILPGSSTYSFVASFPGIPPPLGTGPQTCTDTNVTISGASQTVTFSSCAALTNILSGTGCTASGTIGTVQASNGVGGCQTTSAVDNGTIFNVSEPFEADGITYPTACAASGYVYGSSPTSIACTGTLIAHGLMTTAVTAISPNAGSGSGYPLVSNGLSSDPSYQQITVEAAVPSATVFTDQSATFGAHTYDFSGATLDKARNSAGLTTTAIGDFGYDTTNKNWHGYNNGADLLFPEVPIGTPVNGDCVDWVVVSSNVRMGDAGAACGSGGGGPGTGTQYAIADWATTSTLGSIGPATSPASIPEFIVSTPTPGGAAQAPTAQLAGIPINPQTGTTYIYESLLSSGTYDRAALTTFSNASAIAGTLGQSGTGNLASNWVNLSCNSGAGTVTITPTTSTISSWNGSAYTSAASSLALTTGQCAWIYSNNTNYFAVKLSGGGGGGDTITSPNSTLNVGGTSTNTTLDLKGAAGEIMAGATPALTFTPTLGVSGTAGTLSLFPASGNFTTTLGSAATASNTVNFFATAPTTGDLIECVTATTTCTFTDTGILATNVVTPSSTTTFTNKTYVSNATGNAFTWALPGTVSGATSGGVGCATSTTAFTTSTALTVNVYPKGGGAGACPTNGLTTDNGTTSVYTGTGGTQSPAFTATGTTAGFVDFPQGTTSAAVAPCNVATSICEQAPTAVTSYLVTKPGVAANGIETNNVASAVDTQGFSGDANHSTTVTISSATSVGSTTLCSTGNCPAGTYNVYGYIDVTTACTTTGSYFATITYTDDQGSKSVVMPLIGTGVTASLLTATGISSSLALSSTSNFAQGQLILRSTGAAAITYTTTAGACATGGPAAGKLYLAVSPVQ